MKYEIPFKLPSLNDYIRVCRSNKYQGAKYKAHVEKLIGECLTEMPRWTKPIKIHFLWVKGNKRRDFDNIAFSKKFILDAMVKFEKLNDDNRKYVTAFTDSFTYSTDGKTKVILEIEEIKEG